jgi:hypothetical protein
MEMQTIGLVLIATAATISIVDCIPGNSMRLKDLETPKEELASHSDIFKLLMGTKVD